ncbi:MAG: Lsr2 dimerization domain-containing protein, partial [Actinocrinis sp.]
MAQKTVVVMTDDLTGGEAGQTIHFSLDNADYVIDLNDKNAAALRADFEKYVNAGRRHRGEPELDAGQFLRAVRAKLKELDIGEDLLQRAVNVGFSGGEKKRNEIFQ